MKRTLAACLLLLTACAGPRPDIPDAARVTPPVAWRDTAASDVQVSPQWWTAFGDPVLTGLVDQALANNADIATAAARVEEAQAGFAAARGALLPAVNADTGGANSRTINAFGQPSSATSGQAELTTSYEIDLFGRLRNASAAARATLLATQYARDTVRLGVAASVAQGYITLRAYDARLVVLQETVATRQQALAAAVHRAETGYSPALERQQAQAEYDSARQQIPAMQLAIRRQEDALSLLLGDAPRAIERGADLDHMTPPSVQPDVPARILRQRPDIAQAE
ncbi:MAG: TolC family protein, partial [Asticcacaulis sp.]|nr:TolC family protein [Asticcacaulis sp.]